MIVNFQLSRAESGVAVAVAEVDAEADRKPDHESNPGEHAQVEHEPDVGERDEDRDPWIAGDFEDSLQIGRFLRMIGIEMETRANADSVPMFTMSARTATLQLAAMSAMSTPTAICRRTGVPCLPV